MALASGSVAMAQITSGRLDGVVSDSQGLALPGVAVTLASPDMLGARVATTDIDGSYRFQSLPPGTLSITYEIQGFATLKREELIVTTGRTFTVNVTLQLATVAECSVNSDQWVGVSCRIRS